MATKGKSTEMRRCVGSKTFGIEPHDAPVADFPVQPSRKDGLGVMCKKHWTEYTGALRRAAQARKAADGGPATKPRRAVKAKATNAGTEAAEIVNAVDADVAGEAKATTKRQRKLAATAHRPVEPADVPPSVQRHIAANGGELPPAIEVTDRSNDGFEAIIRTPETPEA